MKIVRYLLPAAFVAVLGASGAPASVATAQAAARPRHAWRADASPPVAAATIAPGMPAGPDAAAAAGTADLAPTATCRHADTGATPAASSTARRWVMAATSPSDSVTAPR